MKKGRITHLGQQVAWVWQEIPVPVIAAVHGVALGGGIQIALGADIRIVTPDVKMSVLEIRWGLSPDMSGTVTLSRLVHPDGAKELAMTGRMVDGEEAVRLGLATRVSEHPYDDAMTLAREIASKNPHSVRGIKHLFNHARSSTVAEQFAEERRVIGTLIGSANQAEAVRAYFEKRDPVFED
jgi:enoyl-CoA hydratase/carnithine racemase